MYTLIEYSDNYLTNTGNLDDFTSNSALFKVKQKMTSSTGNISLKYLNNFCRMLEIRLIDCELYVILTWSASGVLCDAAANQDTIFPITDTKLYVPVLTLSNQVNAKLLQQLKSGFKHTINWNKYHFKTEPPNALNPYLDFLFNPSF